jgi:hypothetical protein
LVRSIGKWQWEVLRAATYALPENSLNKERPVHPYIFLYPLSNS